MFLSQISRRSCSPASSIPAFMGLSDLWHLGQGIWQFQLPSVLHYSSQSYTEKFFWTMSMKQDSIFVSAFEKFSRSSPLPVSWILLLLNTYVFKMGPIIHWLIFGQYIDLQSKKDLRNYETSQNLDWRHWVPFLASCRAKLAKSSRPLNALQSTSTKQRCKQVYIKILRITTPMAAALR